MTIVHWGYVHEGGGGGRVRTWANRIIECNTKVGSVARFLFSRHIFCFVQKDVQREIVNGLA